MNIHVIIYTKEKGRLELTRQEQKELDRDSITFHRVDGPAVETLGGTRGWYINNKLHRLDGAAVEYFDERREYFIDGEYFYEEEFDKIIKEAKSLPLELRLTDPRWWVREIK